MTDHTALLGLSWPTRPLWENEGSHWARKAKAVASYRTEAWAAALAQNVKRIETDRPYLTFSFHPPDRRKRDLHNLPATMKPAIDGIADAMGVDDQHFLCQFPLEFGPVVAGGCVLIEVKDCPAVVPVPYRGQIT